MPRPRAGEGDRGAGGQRDAFSGRLRARGGNRAVFSPSSSSRSSAPYLLPPPCPSFHFLLPKILPALADATAALPAVTPGEGMNSAIFGWGFGVALAVSPSVPPSLARPRCPSPRKPGLIVGSVTSSRAGGWSGGNKAGFVPLPPTQPSQSSAPPGSTSPWASGAARSTVPVVFMLQGAVLVYFFWISGLGSSQGWMFPCVGHPGEQGSGCVAWERSGMDFWTSSLFPSLLWASPRCAGLFLGADAALKTSVLKKLDPCKCLLIRVSSCSHPDCRD